MRLMCGRKTEQGFYHPEDVELSDHIKRLSRNDHMTSNDGLRLDPVKQSRSCRSQHPKIKAFSLVL